MLAAKSLDAGQQNRLTIEAAAFALSLRGRGLRDTSVIGAMERIPRDVFAPRRFRDLARADVALPLPCGQTMTAPAVVATMLVALGASRGHRVLEIGTGSGYVTCLLVRLGCRVRTIERYATLAEEAAARFKLLGIDGSAVSEIGDGLQPRSEARYDRILVNGAVANVPPAVTSLLAPGGRLLGALLMDSLPRLLKLDRGADGELSQDVGGPLRLQPLVSGTASCL